MKKFTLIIIILFISGCWNYNELNNYSIITGIAIDKADNQFEVSVLISNSPKNATASESNQSEIVVYSGISDSIYGAFKEISLVSPKQLYLGHFSILIISDDIAKDGLNKIFDGFIRETSTRKNFYVLIAKECKAKDTLKIVTALTDFPSQNIVDNLISSSDLQGSISSTDFNGLLSNLIKSGINPVINSINIIGSVEEGESLKNTEKSEPKSYTKLGSLGIFKNDKLISWATKEESIGINIINNKIIENFAKLEINDGYVVVNTTRFTTKIKTKLINNKPLIKINVNGEAEIVEVNSDVDIQKDKNLKIINKKINTYIEEHIKLAINVAIKNKTDIFGFGTKFHQNYPKYYKKVKDNWQDNLDNIEFEIKSNIIIKSKGSAQSSLEVIENE